MVKKEGRKEKDRSSCSPGDFIMQGRMERMPEFKHWWKPRQPRFRGQPRTLNHRPIILYPYINIYVYNFNNHYTELYVNNNATKKCLT